MFIFINISCRRLQDIVVRCDRFKGLLLHINRYVHGQVWIFKKRNECAEAVTEGAKTKLISLKRRMTRTRRSILGLVHGVDLLRAFMD